jgi:DNA-binding transcriptional ArsR family regulator
MADPSVAGWQAKGRYDEFIMPLTQQQRPLYEVKAGLFKGLSHPFRIRILELLASEPELSVAVLQDETGLEASHLSQHLAVLRRHRLVASERRASHVYYRLADPRVADLLAVARALLLDMLRSDGARLADADDLPALPGAPR